MAFGPDARTVATGHADGTAVLWDVAAGNTVHTFNVPGSGIRSVAFSPDGTTLAISSNYTTELRSVKTARTVSTLKGKFSGADSVAFSPDGSMLATNAWLWDVATGQMINGFAQYNGRINSVAFSPDGTILATAEDRTATLWDLATRTATVLEGHTGVVNSVAFGRDGILATGSRDQTVLLWDIGLDIPTRQINDHTGSVDTVAFSPDGTILASVSADRVVRLSKVL